MLLDHYDKHKSRMPKEWFVVDRADFVGLSDEALEMLTETRTWYEMKCLQQVEHGFLRALHGANDTVSTFSDVDARDRDARRSRNHDEQAIRLCIRFFNNYLREAIKARNLRAVYDVFHQYRRLGRDLVDRPELLREIGAPLRVLRGDVAHLRHGVRAAARAVRPRLRHAPRVRARVARGAGSAARSCSRCRIAPATTSTRWPSRRS